MQLALSGESYEPEEGVNRVQPNVPAATIYDTSRQALPPAMFMFVDEIAQLLRIDFHLHHHCFIRFHAH